MKKKKQLPEENDNMNALEDTQIYRAGSEADEELDDDNEADDLVKHTNGGIPDDTGDDSDDEDDEDDEDDDDDERA